MDNPVIEKALGRWPDFIVGDKDDPYLLRWYIIPRNKVFNIYLHKFCRSDDDRALHDHPWLFNCSILLRGSYFEHRFKQRKNEYARSTLPGITKKFRNAFSFVFRWRKSPHRVELMPRVDIDTNGNRHYHPAEQPCWTIFITGPRVREWGFYCPKGWRHWKIFVADTDTGNTTGRGCE